MNTDPSVTASPPGYVPFARRESRSRPARVRVSDAVALETLHLPGDDPALAFVHGGLGSPWNPQPQPDAFAGERGVGPRRAIHLTVPNPNGRV